MAESWEFATGPEQVFRTTGLWLPYLDHLHGDPVEFPFFRQSEIEVVNGLRFDVLPEERFMVVDVHLMPGYFENAEQLAASVGIEYTYGEQLYTQFTGDEQWNHSEDFVSFVPGEVGRIAIDVAGTRTEGTTRVLVRTNGLQEIGFQDGTRTLSLTKLTYGWATDPLASRVGDLDVQMLQLNTDLGSLLDGRERGTVYLPELAAGGTIVEVGWDRDLGDSYTVQATVETAVAPLTVNVLPGSREPLGCKFIIFNPTETTLPAASGILHVTAER